MVELTKYGRYHLLLLCEWIFNMRVMHCMHMYIYRARLFVFEIGVFSRKYHSSQK